MGSTHSVARTANPDGRIDAGAPHADDPQEAFGAWPALPVAKWEATRDTVHLWCQIVGKTRLALTSMQNHWWNVPFYVNSVGLTT